MTDKTKYAIQFANNRTPENLELKRKHTNIATRESRKIVISFWFAKSEELKSNQGSVFNTLRPFISSKTKDSNMICLQSEGCRVEVAEQLANYFTTAANSIAEDHVTSIREENLDNHCSINAIREASLRCMAILSSRAHENERQSREKRFFKLLPPQSFCGFSALAHLYYLARPTKTPYYAGYHEVQKALKSNKANKSCGWDPRACITKTPWKWDSKIAPSLTTPYNSCIELGKWVCAWKMGGWTPVFKSGDRQEGKNYRPITSLVTVNKNFE